MVASRLVTLEDPVALSAFKAGQDKYTEVSTGAPRHGEGGRNVEGTTHENAPVTRQYMKQGTCKTTGRGISCSWKDSSGKLSHNMKSYDMQVGR